MDNHSEKNVYRPVHWRGTILFSGSLPPQPKWGEYGNSNTLWIIFFYISCPSIFQKTVVRIFGQTALIRGGKINEIVKHVFLKKPCFGVWRDLGDIYAGALESMHLVNHVTKRYYSPHCRIFSKDKYGEDRFTMTPGLCKACDALAPRRSPCSKTKVISDPIKEDIGDQIGNDVDCHDYSDSHNWITKEENIETDLQPVVSMDEDEFGADAWFNDDTVHEKPLDTAGQVGGSKALDTSGTSVRIHWKIIFKLHSL